MTYYTYIAMMSPVTFTKDLMI